MLRVIGTQPPNLIPNLQLAGVCPHCALGTRFNRATIPIPNLRQDNPSDVIVGYACDICSKPVAIQWKVSKFDNGGQPIVFQPEMILRVREPFEFTHVPDTVKKEIEEGLNCLSLNAYNGFAALCRRTIQAACTALGAEGTTKVQAQIKEMAELTGLDEETKSIATEIMLAGHDGSHPHLPDVNIDRAVVLLSLLRDLAYQLFTRPGNIKESAKLRKTAIDSTR
jgi:hypothetical protein